MSDNTDDTMRRIEEALKAFLSWAMWPDGYPDGLKAKLLATIRAALQPDAGGWGEDDDRHRANEEHERAVEAWRQTMCQEIENLTKHANKPGSETKFFGALFGSLKTTIDDGVRLMRRQPKETP